MLQNKLTNDTYRYYISPLQIRNLIEVTQHPNKQKKYYWGEQVLTVLRLYCAINPAISHEETETNANFECIEAVEIPIENYIKQFSTAKNWNELAIQTLCIMNKACADSGMIINQNNVHRLTITAYTLATKLQHDSIKVNKTIANLGGLDLDDLNLMEESLLNILDWEFYNPTTYLVCRNGLPALINQLTDCYKNPLSTPTTTDFLDKINRKTICTLLTQTPSIGHLQHNPIKRELFCTMEIKLDNEDIKITPTQS